jgi:hypothetical protein
MKTELIALQPQLIETGKEVAKTLIVVNAQTVEAESKKVVVVGEQEVANVKAAAAKAIKDECESELAVALPMLEAALKVGVGLTGDGMGKNCKFIKTLHSFPLGHPSSLSQALDTLTKSDISEVKSMKSPPAVVKLVMEAVCIMLQVKPKKVSIEGQMDCAGISMSWTLAFNILISNLSYSPSAPLHPVLFYGVVLYSQIRYCCSGMVFLMVWVMISNHPWSRMSSLHGCCLVQSTGDYMTDPYVMGR